MHELLNDTPTYINGSSGSITVGEKRKHADNNQSFKRSKFGLDFDSLCSNIGIEITTNNLFESLTTSKYPELNLKSLNQDQVSFDQLDIKGVKENDCEGVKTEYELNECDIMDGPNEDQLTVNPCSYEVSST